MGLLSRIFRKKCKKDDQLIHALNNIFGFKPHNIALYKLAFRHKSMAKSASNGHKHSNERLEYLGDAVLGSIIADFLFKKFPYKDEGFLTEIRSRIVSREHLNLLSRKLGIDKLVVTNKDFFNIGASAMGDAFEALIGAMYLDKGYRFTYKTVVSFILQTHVDLDELVIKEVNFKSKIIEWAQKEKKQLEFEVAEEIEDTRKLKIYLVNLLVDKELIAQGKDFSIKKAEQSAARQACEKIFDSNS